MLVAGQCFAVVALVPGLGAHELAEGVTAAQQKYLHNDIDKCSFTVLSIYLDTMKRPMATQFKLASIYIPLSLSSRE